MAGPASGYDVVDKESVADRAYLMNPPLPITIGSMSDEISKQVAEFELGVVTSCSHEDKSVAEPFASSRVADRGRQDKGSVPAAEQHVDASTKFVLGRVQDGGIDCDNDDCRVDIDGAAWASTTSSNTPAVSRLTPASMQAQASLMGDSINTPASMPSQGGQSEPGQPPEQHRFDDHRGRSSGAIDGSLLSAMRGWADDLSRGEALIRQHEAGRCQPISGPWAVGDGRQSAWLKPGITQNPWLQANLTKRAAGVLPQLAEGVEVSPRQPASNSCGDAGFCKGQLPAPGVDIHGFDELFNL